jgi:hypothetical protein
VGFTIHPAAMPKGSAVLLQIHQPSPSAVTIMHQVLPGVDYGFSLTRIGDIGSCVSIPPITAETFGHPHKGS